MKIAGRIALGVTLAMVALAGGACASSNSTTGTTTITVGAASSLTDVFVTIGDAFTRANPDVAVRFSFAGSSAIAEQIRQGAPIDVFASAGTTSMQPLTDADLVTDVTAFAANSLQIVTPPGNPADVQGLEDLAGVKVIVCQEQVPCGAAARQLFEANDLTVSPAGLEPDVRSVLAKVEADEADAGIVYVTDVKSVGSMVVGIPIPAERNVSSTYQAAVVQETSNADAAAAFVAYLTTPDAQAILAAAGFAPAP